MSGIRGEPLLRNEAHDLGQQVFGDHRGELLVGPVDAARIAPEDVIAGVLGLRQSDGP
jgi:hypothetical protein